MGWFKSVVVGGAWCVVRGSIRPDGQSSSPKRLGSEETLPLRLRPPVFFASRPTLLRGEPLGNLLGVSLVAELQEPGENFSTGSFANRESDALLVLVEAVNRMGGESNGAIHFSRVPDIGWPFPLICLACSAVAWQGPPPMLRLIPKEKPYMIIHLPPELEVLRP